MAKGNKEEIEGFVKIFKLMGTIVTKRYCIHPKKGEDLLHQIMKHFKGRYVRITVEDIDDSKEFKIPVKKGFLRRFLDAKKTRGSS